MNYRDKFTKDLNEFAELGIITREQQAAMLARVPAGRRLLSLANVLVILAAILISAALFSLIAANWEVIPRIVRVVSLFVICWACYFGAAYFLARQMSAIGQGLVLVALATFGGSLALIGQMYHLPGDFPGAVLLCIAMAFVATLALRVPVAAIIFGLLIGVYLFGALVEARSWHHDAYIFLVPVLLLVSCGLGIWLQNKNTAHIIAIVTLCYLGVLPFHFDQVYAFSLLYLAGVAGFAAIIRFKPTFQSYTGFATPGLVYLALLILGSLLILQINELEQSGFGGILIALVLLVTIAGLLFFAADESRAFRMICYAAFTFEVFYIYVQTVGSILGTAGFFFIMALFALALAAGVIATEKRLKHRVPEAGDVS